MSLLKIRNSSWPHQVRVSGGNENEYIPCPKCGGMVERDRVVKLKYICYDCGYNFRVKTPNRISMVADKGTFEAWFEGMQISNPLEFAGYEEKVLEARERTGLDEALTVGRCKVFGEEAVIGICDSRFMMASMGHTVGEKLTLAIERAVREHLPVFVFCCSGGARMQEGIVSLMQMAKTSAAVSRLKEAGLLYCTILTDPTTGGVTASFAMLGDVIMAEPGALIGFAGPRVIRQTIGEELPEGFQTSEFLLQHGLIDGIVERRNLKKTIYFMIKSHKSVEGNYSDFDETDVEYKISELVNERMHYSIPKTPWEKVRGVRQATRPQGLDYIEYIFDVFIEAHGDRAFSDDESIVGGIGFIGNQPVTVISEDRGKNPEDYRKKNFGMPLPEGYRKALRLMKQAQQFNRPVICFVNTPGAYPGMEAEERGMGESIAKNLMGMSELTVPILCILVGEGGSGGALATAVGNEVWMLENATYSILSPEGFASILWKDSNRAKEASEVMKITANDLFELKVIEKIIPEYGGADEVTKEAIGKNLKKEICLFLEKYRGMSKEMIREERYKRFRNF
ncbi:MAG: acetyl-CoA carboxylase carboxyl transferase subunit alpha [Lachnospiraceae bacterium]|nr:acetyl-CoA carboxylase carboxyl transferase subunit alpha [Lachnospiraceae bacterium]